MAHSFDAFIIGGGPAGQHLARYLAQHDFTVGIAEYRGFGGTCALRGCDPKRIMATVSEAVDGVDRLVGKGVAGEARMAWDDVRAFVTSIIEPIPERAEERLRELGIATFTDKATFTGPGRLTVAGESVEAQHVIIATGQRPAPLDVPGEAFAKTSDDFHHLEAIPERVLFVGGGYIGLETAHICCRLGAEVTILHNDDDPLPMFEGDLADGLVAATRELGIRFVLDTEVTAIEQADTGFRVSAKTTDGETCHYDTDLVMNTAGRVPNVEGLGLDALGIDLAGGSGIEVDAYLRVEGHDGLYAIGDISASDGPPLTPVATLEAKALAATLRGTPTAPSYAGLPTAVYSLPELAGVGLSEAEAREQGYDVAVVAKLDATEQFNAKRSNARAYAYKTVVDKATDKLLGATILGPDASEVINLFALAIRAGIDVEHLRDTPYAYPTWSSDVAGMV